MNNNSIDLVILIDDSEVANYYNTEVIRSAGLHAEVKCFTDPDEGLKFVRDTMSPEFSGQALLLCDIRMPGATGFDVLTELEDDDIAADPRLVIGLLSSSNMIRDREDFRKFPDVRGFIQKPLDAYKLNKLFLGTEQIIE